jgi:hypothetical protein
MDLFKILNYSQFKYNFQVLSFCNEKSHFFLRTKFKKKNRYLKEQVTNPLVLNALSLNYYLPNQAFNQGFNKWPPMGWTL